MPISNVLETVTTCQAAFQAPTTSASLDFDIVEDGAEGVEKIAPLNLVDERANTKMFFNVIHARPLQQQTVHGAEGVGDAEALAVCLQRPLVYDVKGQVLASIRFHVISCGTGSSVL